jgi:WG containing repeat
MKTSSVISLICSLTINGFNTFYQPAAAQQLPPAWHVAEALSPAESANEDDKLIAVQVGGKYGYQDATGRMAISPRFDNVYEFFDGLAAVSIGGKWGFIDRSGRAVIALQFDNAVSFNHGLAAVKVGDKWGFINKQGAVAIAPIYDEVDSFHNDMAWIRIDKKVGYIDQTGKFLK